MALDTYPLSYSPGTHMGKESDKLMPFAKPISLFKKLSLHYYCQVQFLFNCPFLALLCAWPGILTWNLLGQLEEGFNRPDAKQVLMPL